MKKIKILLLVTLSLFILTGCSKLFINEINYRVVDVEDFTVKDLDDLLTTSIAKAEGSVIGVNTYKMGSIFGHTLAGSGSGVVYDCEAVLKDNSIIDDCMKTINRNDVKRYDYRAVTNRHVIEGHSKIKVYIGQIDELTDANVVHYDNKVDLAVIRFSHQILIKPIEFADSDNLKRGSIAIAIGNPHGHEFWGSATFGIISFPKRYLPDDTDGDKITDWDNEYIQHDVAINPGNSGGALINIEGKLIGINTLKFVSEETDGMGFAIPSNVVKELIKYLEKGTRPYRITLGMSFYPVKYLINPEEYQIPNSNEYIIPEDITYGIYVADLGNNINNRQFKLGDIILEINDKQIIYSYHIRAELDYKLPGSVIKFLVLRENEEIVINITV